MNIMDGKLNDKENEEHKKYILFMPLPHRTILNMFHIIARV
jgi:hypothetical protein